MTLQVNRHENGICQKDLPTVHSCRAMTLIVHPNTSYIRWFMENDFMGTADLEYAELVVFTGGEDVDPQLYGERALAHTNFNVDRDKKEIEIFNYCLENYIPMVGICRGAQFLNVMNGGKLWQDVDNHGRTHKVLNPFCPDNEEFHFEVTSTHHQMMRPTDKADILLIAKESTRRDAYGEGEKGKSEDVEACFYPDTMSLCIQGHPEYPMATDEFRRWCVSTIDTLLLEK